MGRKHDRLRRQVRLSSWNATFDLSSSALQLGILLASASVVTSVLWLVYLGAGLGAIGALLGILGVVAPHILGG